MNAISFRIKVRDLPPEQAARLETPLDPDREVEVTIEEVPDFSDVPPDILESQIEGLRERMATDDIATDDIATDEEVEAFFGQWLGKQR
jgi:hypothetical protein